MDWEAKALLLIVDTLVGHFSLVSLTQLYNHVAYEFHDRRGTASRLTLDRSTPSS